MESQILGIDFGTTYTIISFFKNNKSELFKIDNNYLIPSEVLIKNNEYYCGYQIPINEEGNIIKNFKTKIGSNYYYNFENTKIHVNQVILIYLKYIKNLINLNKDNNTVISVPSNFTNNQRVTLKQIFSEVGFNIIRIINEPTSAAISYGLSNTCDQEDKILVFDIGGGTLDITILEKDELFFEIIESLGNQNLGGKNFTDVIFDDIKLKFGLENFNNYEKNILWKKCNTIKEMFIFSKIQIISYKEIYYEITYSKFIKLCKNLINNIKNLIKSIENKNVNRIILVGGSSKLKIINDILTEFYNCNLNSYEDLQSVVSKGNCKYANILYKKNIVSDIIIIDCLQISIGLETDDGNFSIIIPKNTPLPAIKKKKYRIIEKNDDFKIKIYQGERKIACKNKLLYILDLQKYFNKNDINKIIEVIFKINLNGIVEISILNDYYNINEKIDSKISKYEINKLLKDANFNIEKDSEKYKINKYIFIIERKILKLLDEIKNNKKLSNERKNSKIEELQHIRNNIYNYNLQMLIKIEKKIINLN
jgi:molecular chaperone DnaK